MPDKRAERLRIAIKVRSHRQRRREQRDSPAPVPKPAFVVQRDRAADPKVQRNHHQVKGEDLDCLPIPEQGIQQILRPEKTLIDLPNAHPHPPQKQDRIDTRDSNRIRSYGG
jgi:hypothetical protein